MANENTNTATYNKIADMFIAERCYINAHIVHRLGAGRWLVSGEEIIGGINRVVRATEEPNRDALIRWTYLRISELRSHLEKATSLTIQDACSKELVAQYTYLEVLQMGWEIMSNHERSLFAEAHTY